MLGKLIKHEFKATGRLLVWLNLALVGITIIGSVLLSVRVLQRTELMPLTITLMLVYVTSLFAVSVGGIIFLIIQYYRSMFSSQGYLTFTLPASPWQIFNSKLITGVIWVLINSVITFISGLTLIAAAVGFKNVPDIVNMIFNTTIPMEINGELTSVSLAFSDIFGYTPGQLVIWILVLLVSSCFYSVAIAYGSITIGQLYAKHKVVGSVLAYVGFYIVVQIIMSISMFAIMLRPMLGIAVPDSSGAMSEFADVSAMMRSIYRPMFPTIIIVYLVIGIAAYIASVLIVKKKVNLD